jgi:hypothetical protein
MIRFRNPKNAVSSHDVPGGFLEDLRRDPTCRNEIESGAWRFVVLQLSRRFLPSASRKGCRRSERRARLIPSHPAMPKRVKSYVVETLEMANNPAGEPPSVEVTKSWPNAQGTGHPPGFDLALEPIEAAAKRAAELFVSIERGLESRRVAPAAMRSAIQDRFAGTLGENGVGLLGVLDEFERLILPDCMTTPHPLYLGLVNSSPLPGAALADLLIIGAQQ